MSNAKIIPYSPTHKADVIQLTIDAWTPVFTVTEHEVPRFAYDNFYPQGWEARQTSEVSELLDGEPENIWLAMVDSTLAGFLGLRIHPEDQMGEIYIIAVSPEHQRQGVGKQLAVFAEDHIRAAGMKMVMVETIGDAGHAPARRTYEAIGFKRWPIARYFKEL